MCIWQVYAMRKNLGYSRPNYAQNLYDVCVEALRLIDLIRTMLIFQLGLPDILEGVSHGFRICTSTKHQQSQVYPSFWGVTKLKRLL